MAPRGEMIVHTVVVSVVQGFEGRSVSVAVEEPNRDLRRWITDALYRFRREGGIPRLPYAAGEYVFAVTFDRSIRVRRVSAPKDAGRSTTRLRDRIRREIERAFDRGDICLADPLDILSLPPRAVDTSPSSSA